MIPKQEYELINVLRQSVETGTAYVCNDCGRIIFNIATIKGKRDGQTYRVGLTCVKKLLNKTIYFNDETQSEYERKVAEWNEAWNARKWLDRQQKRKIERGQRPYSLTLKEYHSDEYDCDFVCVYMQGEQSWDTGSTVSIRKEYASVYKGLIFQ